MSRVGGNYANLIEKRVENAVNFHEVVAAKEISSRKIGGSREYRHSISFSVAT